MLSADLAGKRLELLREVVPNLRRVAIMGNIGNPFAVLELGEVQAAAAKLGLEVDTLEIRSAQDIAPAFEVLKTGADALFTSASTRSQTPTGFGSIFWRLARACRRCTGTGITSKPEV